MDPPRSPSSRATRLAAKGQNASRPPRASTSGHPHQLSEPATAGEHRLYPKSTRSRQKSPRTVAPNDLLGQFSFAPATQTTVVTTTTTTTTSFPPLLIKEPRNVQYRDPVLYPLAKLHTPASLKNVLFTLGDRQAVFREAEDAAGTLDEVSCAGLPCCNQKLTLFLHV